ncbi:MAG: hypothetical protein LBS91_06495 [Clostridiales Family XIII bacterium]|jgi:YbbR domain-containing protein|nr:hypothetical protein [Clostridiales Family XIII bacterium]
MLKSNKINLLISIVAAIALWAYITTVVNPETETTIGNIPVELVNIDALNDRGFTINEGMTYLVDITVTGARSEVAKLTSADFRATADMTGYRKGENAVPVNVIKPNNIELVQVRPETILVAVVDLITVNKPVKLEFADEFTGGAEPGFISILPEEMEVSGVTAVVDSIDYIRAVVPEGVLAEEAKGFSLDVVAISKDGQPVYNVGLSQSQVQVTAALCATKIVPLKVDTLGEPNENIEVTDMHIPSYITIRGPKAAIEGIAEVEGRAVDLSEIANTMEIPIDPYLPQNVEVADASQNISVKIEVQGIVKREFEYTADMIEVANLSPALSGHVNTGSVTVTVLAPEAIAARLTQSDIKLFVDATDYRKAGNSIEMEVTAECGIEVKSIAIEPAKVRVTIIRED